MHRDDTYCQYLLYKKKSQIQESHPNPSTLEHLSQWPACPWYRKPSTSTMPGWSSCHLLPKLCKCTLKTNIDDYKYVQMRYKGGSKNDIWHNGSKFMMVLWTMPNSLKEGPPRRLKVRLHLFKYPNDKNVHKMSICAFYLLLPTWRTILRC